MTSKPRQESTINPYDIETYLADIESALEILDLIVSEYFCSATPQNGALLYLAMQARNHTRDMREAMFPCQGGG